MAFAFIDGAERVISNGTGKKSYKLGAGVLYKGPNGLLEYMFSTVVPVPGLAEYYAYACMNYLYPTRFEIYKGLKVYTDCQLLAYANEVLHVPNGHGIRREQLLKEIDRLFQHIPETDPSVKKDMHLYQFEKVKGHSGIVYNERADYLAKQALVDTTVRQPFDDWVLEPQRYWDTKAGEYAFKYFPFCGAGDETKIRPSSSLEWREEK